MPGEVVYHALAEEKKITAKKTANRRCPIPNEGG